VVCTNKSEGSTGGGAKKAPPSAKKTMGKGPGGIEVEFNEDGSILSLLILNDMGLSFDSNRLK
jgi:hypothetical protein